MRRRAEALGLPVAGKPDSQEICFVPDGDQAGFVERRALARRAAPGPGPVEDESGQRLGEHAGIHRFTIGQRRGLGFAGPGGRPLYVTRIDPERRAVVVGERAAAERTSFHAADLTWLGPVPTGPFRAAVQVRHRGRPLAAEITPDGLAARVHLLEDTTVAAPGQAAVFYDGDTVLGGGWIQ